ncbi:MAG: hypothetical protein ABI222_10710 [Opitutaceae bacterium]
MAIIAAVILTLAGVTISAPTGWHEVERTEDRLDLQSADNREQATISVMRFRKALSFESFKRLSAVRYEAEKKVGPDIFIEPDNPKPSQKKDYFCMLYTGGEKKGGRIFSCSMRLVGNELVTVYVEGSGVAPEKHLKSFEFFVKELKQ